LHYFSMRAKIEGLYNAVVCINKIFWRGRSDQRRQIGPASKRDYLRCGKPFSQQQLLKKHNQLDE